MCLSYPKEFETSAKGYKMMERKDLPSGNIVYIPPYLGGRYMYMGETYCSRDEVGGDQELSFLAGGYDRYPAGFHFFNKKKDALKMAGGLNGRARICNSKRQYVVVEVEFEDVVETGMEVHYAGVMGTNTYEVIVAQKIKLVQEVGNGD